MGLRSWFNGYDFSKPWSEVKAEGERSDAREASSVTRHSVGCSCHWCKLARTNSKIYRERKWD
jgi:hypothetical protein